MHDINERGALFQIARLLHRKFGKSEQAHFVLVANIVPELTWHEYGLTQIDAFLFGERFVAIIDFKSYLGPIIGGDPNKRWYLKLNGGKRRHVRGGKSTNPYKQMRYARYKWTHFLQEQTSLHLSERRIPEIIPGWHHLNGCILFYPYLHPDSRLEIPEADRKWFHFLSVDEIVEYIFQTFSPKLQLTLVEMCIYAEKILQAKPWPELIELIDDKVGYIYILQSDHTWGINPIPIHRFATLTIGRSRKNDIRVPEAFAGTSGGHNIFSRDCGVKDTSMINPPTCVTVVRHVRGKPVLGQTHTDPTN